MTSTSRKRLAALALATIAPVSVACGGAGAGALTAQGLRDAIQDTGKWIIESELALGDLYKSGAAAIDVGRGILESGAKKLAKQRELLEGASGYSPDIACGLEIQRLHIEEILWEAKYYSRGEKPTREQIKKRVEELQDRLKGIVVPEGRHQARNLLSEFNLLKRTLRVVANLYPDGPEPSALVEKRNLFGELYPWAAGLLEQSNGAEGGKNAREHFERQLEFDATVTAYRDYYLAGDIPNWEAVRTNCKKVAEERVWRAEMLEGVRRAVTQCNAWLADEGNAKREEWLGILGASIWECAETCSKRPEAKADTSTAASEGAPIGSGL